MQNLIATYSELGEDYRAVVRQMKPYKVYVISARFRGKDFRVFDISLWADDVDGEKSVVRVAARDFANNTVAYLNLARDLLINLRVMARGGISYLIEPRLGAIAWNRRRLGLPSVGAYKQAILGGGLRDLMVPTVQALLERYRKRSRKARARRDRAEEERSSLTVELAHYQTEVARVQGELGRVTNSSIEFGNIKNAQAERIRQLEQYIIDNCLPLPPYGGVPPWND